ncbi:hypothetical protein D3C87_1921190 [compost metagenome]
MLDIKPSILSVSVRETYLIDRVARIKRAVGNLFDKVCQFQVHLFFVLQGQRVAFAAQFYGKEGVNCAAFNL